MNPYLVELRQRAEQGDSESQLELYHHLKANDESKEAIKWLKIAAEHGNLLAQMSLAQALYFGEEMEINYADSLKWMLIAAYKDNSQAQTFVAHLYREGLGARKDLVESFAWYSVCLDGIISRGLQNWNVEKQCSDLKSLLSASETDSANIRINSIKKRIGFLSENASPDKTTSALEAWEIKASAQAGNPRAQVQHALNCLKGQGVPRDTSEAATWTLKAAEQNFAPAQWMAGDMFRRGLGLSEDLVQAFAWNQLAASAGYDPAIKTSVELTSVLSSHQISEGLLLAVKIHDRISRKS